MSQGKTKEWPLCTFKSPWPPWVSTNNPPASTNTVNSTIRNSATGNKGLLDPGASLMKLILKARLFNDLFSFQRLVLMPMNDQSSFLGSAFVTLEMSQ